ncbi:MAG: transposase [Chitinophagaceae bacterium]
MMLTESYPVFFTATILEWKPLLKQDKYKDIIIDSLSYLVKDKRILLYAFVIMSNHLHVIWHVPDEHKQSDVQRDFLKFTAQMILKDLRRNHPVVSDHFHVKAKDRIYQDMGTAAIEH